MEPQRSQIAKPILRRKIKAGSIMFPFLISNYITKLKQSKQYDIGIKTDTFNGTEQRVQKQSMYIYGQSIYSRETNNINGEKTVSSINWGNWTNTKV